MVCDDTWTKKGTPHFMLKTLENENSSKFKVGLADYIILV